MPRILLTLVFAMVSSGLLALPAPAEVADGEEGETVEEIRKRIQEQEEQAEEEEEADEDEDEYSGCSLLGDIFSAMANSQSGSYDNEYDRSGDGYSRSPHYRAVPPGYSEWGYLGLAVDGAWLGQDRWSAAARLTLNVQYLHLHAFTQVLTDPTGFVICYAANAGVSFSAERLIVNLFAGVFGTDLTSTALLSFGAEARVYLTSYCVLELYSLNAVYYSLQFNFLSLALLYDSGIVSVGASFNLQNYAGSRLLGPGVRLALRI
jgi:hypothetical protein